MTTEPRDKMADTNIIGVHTMPAEDYHADPCPEPSLSASLAKTMIAKSPAHAWQNSERLNPNYARKNSTTFDIGNACHDLLLEGDTGKVCLIEANDWRTKAAKEARDEAYEAGLIPLLPKQHDALLAMYAAAMAFIKLTELAGIFEDGKAEQSLFAQWNGTWLRGRLDWLRTDRKLILDYKTSGQSAEPEGFARTTLFNLGHDIQAAMYTLLNRLTGGPENTSYIWMVQETEEPYACSLVGASPAVLEIGEHKLMKAITHWQDCLNSGKWPAYSPRISYPDPPPWVLAQAEELNFSEDSS